MVASPKPATPAPEPVAAAPATATVTTGPAPASSTFLDTTLVLAVVGIIGGVLLALFFVKTPQENLPIISGLAGTLVGTVIGGYAAYRWGASDAMKKLTAVSTSGQ